MAEMTLSSDEINQLSTAFSMFDMDETGEVDVMMFQAAVSGVGEHKESLEKLFDQQKGESDKIKYGEFIVYLRQNFMVADDLKSEPTAGKPAKKKEYTEEEKQEINRAVVVIKKAFLKKLPREDVMKFLRTKGVREDLIEHAWSLAQSEGNPQQRIRGLKEQLEKQSKEATEFSYENKKLKKRLAVVEEENAKLQDTLILAVEMVVSSYKQASNTFCPNDVLAEVKTLLSETKDKTKRRQLEQMLDMLNARRFVVAWLLFQTFPFSKELGDTQLFLDDFRPST